MLCASTSNTWWEEDTAQAQPRKSKLSRVSTEVPTTQEPSKAPGTRQREARAHASGRGRARQLDRRAAHTGDNLRPLNVMTAVTQTDTVAVACHQD